MTSDASILEALGVSFAYGRDQVLDNVSLHVDPGEFVALAGPNGSGKSTLLRLMLGLQRMQTGTIRILGQPPDRLHDRWRLGYVPQRPPIAEHLPATIEEVVASGRLARRGWRRQLTAEDRDEIEHALESVALLDRRSRLLTELSGGQQQRVFIAKALVTRPDVLVLDEPVAGVDIESQARFRDSLVHLVDEHGAGVLLVSHELGPVADDLDRVMVLRHGRVSFDGPPAELTAAGVSLGIHREDLPLWLEGPPEGASEPDASVAPGPPWPERGEPEGASEPDASVAPGPPWPERGEPEGASEPDASVAPGPPWPERGEPEGASEPDASVAPGPPWPERDRK